MSVQRGPLHDNYYVYVLLCQDEGGPGYAKFGHSRRIGDRIAQVRSHCPVPIHAIGIMEVGHHHGTTVEVEKALHRRFKDRNIRGEWFRFDFDDAADKDEFNRGCREAFSTVLGHKYEWWTKISTAALDREERKRRLALVNSRKGRSEMRKHKRRKSSRRAWRELEEYENG